MASRPRVLRSASVAALAALAVAAAGCRSGGSGGHGGIASEPTAGAPRSVLPQDSISGVVTAGGQPMADAVVRVKATANETRTDARGRFTLGGLVPNTRVAVTAWASGYYIGGGQEHMPGAGDVRIELKAHAETDNPAYEWVSALASAGAEANCENCHSQPGDPSSSLPFDEWLRDAHSASAQNVRFLTMYTGSDVSGNQSPFARFGESRRFSGTDPLVPEAGQPYFGPGFKLDYPYVGGSCSACHAPSAELVEPYGVDPTTVSGVGAEGVTCDLCHKVWDVRLDPDTGLPNRDAPGILSYEFRRPAEGHQFFAGPLDDVAPGEDTYTPIQKRSEYCAGCHYGVFWDTTVYNSYGEWKDSTYSDPVTGRTCQSCHMPAGLGTHFALAEKGGVKRVPSQVVSHKMLGISDEAFMRDAVTMTTSARRVGARIVVDVAITNHNTGHHVPTDSPLRQLILVVRALEDDGDLLPQASGPTVPSWAGVGDPDHGYFAGLPGTGYAKILQEFRSAVSPTGAYWNPTRILGDSRIPALATASTSYEFETLVPDDVNVEAVLVFRRAFIALSEQKGWPDADLVLHRQTVRVGAR